MADFFTISNVTLIYTGKRIVYEYSRMHNLNMYDGGELRNSTRQYG